MEYLGLQVPRGQLLGATDLTFMRTALVDRSRYWIWGFTDPDGCHCYATMSVNARGNSMLGYGEDYYGLTPEQFILGEYHQVF